MSKVANFFSTSADFTLKLGTQEKASGVSGKVIQVLDMIRFVGGRYSTDDPKKIAALRKCSEYGKRVMEESAEDRELLADAQDLHAALKEKKAKGGTYQKAGKVLERDSVLAAFRASHK